MKRKPINWLKIRIFVLLCLIFVCFGLISGRMFQLQVLKKEALYRMAAQQQHAQIPLVPKRGTISDREGNELAVSIEVDSVYADPQKIVDPGRTAQSLVAILQIDPEELKERLRSKNSFEWIQRKISPKEADEIKALRLPGISFLKENKRFYPAAQSASHVIGFVGLDSKGLEGLESQYDKILTGNQQVWTPTKDARGREIVDSVSPREDDRYQNLILTLDQQIQHLVEVELGRTVQKWGARGGFAIVMEPATGKILSMAVYPSFNPNQFLQYRAGAWKNRTIVDTFEPGSMFKTFLAAAAIEEKIVRPTDSFYCENGSYTVYDRTIHDHSRHGWLTFQQIIKFSSNIGASKVGEKMGKDCFYRYIKAFGFGEKTQVGLPGREQGHPSASEILVARCPRYHLFRPGDFRHGHSIDHSPLLDRQWRFPDETFYRGEGHRRKRPDGPVLSAGNRPEGRDGGNGKESGPSSQGGDREGRNRGRRRAGGVRGGRKDRDRPKGGLPPAGVLGGSLYQRVHGFRAGRRSPTGSPRRHR